MFKKLFHNTLGVSLIELSISIGLSGIIIYGVMFISTTVTQRMRDLDRKTEPIIDEAFSKIVIMDDLLYSTPSFNFLDVRTKFVDETNDIAKCIPTPPKANFWLVTEKDYCKPLQIILEKAGDSIAFLIVDRSKTSVSGKVIEKESILVSPIVFYNTSFSTNKLKSVLSKHGIWVKDYMVKFRGITPVINSQGNSVDYGLLLGNKGSSLSPVSSIVKTLPMQNNHCSSLIGNSLDRFLRCMPSSGAIGRVFVEPVVLVEYKLMIPAKTNYNGFVLYRTVRKFSAMNELNKRIAGNVKQISFVRTLSSTNLIDFNIEYYDRFSK